MLGEMAELGADVAVGGQQGDGGRRVAAGVWARLTLSVPLAVFVMLSGFVLSYVHAGETVRIADFRQQLSAEENIALEQAIAQARFDPVTSAGFLLLAALWLAKRHWNISLRGVWRRATRTRARVPA